VPIEIRRQIAVYGGLTSADDERVKPNRLVQ
jgi:hypothetical protein